MSEDQARHLETGSGAESADRERLDFIRAALRDEVTWLDPPPEVAARIMDDIAAAARPHVRRRPGWLGAAVIVGALLVAVIAAASLFPTQQEEVVAMVGTEIETTAIGEAAIRITGSGWWIRLEIDGLPPAPEDTYYEGWMWSDEGHGVSIGTFHLRDDDQPVILWSGVDPADYPSIWVTLEDEDGDPAASERVVMQGRTEG
jgi:hypothetical protein